MLLVNGTTKSITRDLDLGGWGAWLIRVEDTLYGVDRVPASYCKLEDIVERLMWALILRNYDIVND